MTFVSRVIAAVGRLVTQPYGSCPACGKKGPNLHVAHRMPLALVELDEEQRNLKLGAGSAMYPLAAITCSNCGYVRFHNTRYLLDTDDDE